MLESDTLALQRNAQADLVSIVLTTLNGARYLHEAIDSCLAQTYSNLELIIVDGGSTDGTLDIVASYTDPRVMLVNQPHNSGKLPGALNLGLARACGEYLTWMQDDCVYEPTALETMVQCLRANPHVGQVYTDYWQIDAQGRVVGHHETCEPDEILKSRSDPLGVCFLLRRSVREAVGEHDIEAYPCQDADYRWRIAMKFDSLHIAQPLISWRFHPDSLSGTISWRDLARNDIRVRRRLNMISPLQAWHERGETDIAFAFDRFQGGYTTEVPRLVLAGIVRNPAYVLNRGVLSILIRSILPGHSAKPGWPHAETSHR